ncbi:MAG: hypothetical protein OXN87_03865, partial [Chloroflexota bacterium]|nr:hypothetical protein [Chloroflexota bacterium]
MSGFVQICLDGCGFIWKLWRLVRFRLGGSRFVQFGVGGLGALVGFGKVVQGSEMRQGVVAFVEVGAAHRALGQALAVVVAGDVTDVSVLVGQEMPASSESDSVGLAGVDELFALFALLFLEVGQGGEEETQLSGGGDGLAVLVGVGVGGGED